MAESNQEEIQQLQLQIAELQSEKDRLTHRLEGAAKAETEYSLELHRAETEAEKGVEKVRWRLKGDLEMRREEYANYRRNSNIKIVNSGLQRVNAL